MGAPDDPGKPAPLLWWGYAHVNDTYNVKRYFGPRDIEEARESDFVKSVSEPFEAVCRADAINKLMDRLSGKVLVRDMNEKAKKF